MLKSIHIITILTLLTVLTNTQTGLECLLEGKDNVSDECLTSIDTSLLFKTNPEIGVYTCTITAARNLLQKAKQACTQATKYSEDSRYTLLEVYIKMGNILEAYKYQYRLFFSNPYIHQQKVQKILVDSVEKLTQFLESEERKENYVEKAIILAYLGKFESSEKELKNVQEDTSESLFLRLRIKEQMNQFTQGLQLSEKAIKNKELMEGDFSWYVYHVKGNFLMHHLKFNEAIKAFEMSIQANTKDQFSFDFYNIGICYQKLNEFEKSLKYLKKAVFLNPNAVETLNALGFSHSSIKNPQNIKAAETYFQKAIEANNEYFITYFNYGVHLFNQRKYKQAIQIHKRALKIKQNFMSAHYGVFRATYRLDRDEGLQVIKKIASRKDADKFELSRLLYQQEQYELAEQYVVELAERDKNNQLYEWLGLINFQLSKYKESQSNFKQSIKLGNKKAHTWFNLGYCQQIQKKYEEAIQSYKISHQLDPKSPAKDKIKELQKYVKQEEDEL